MHTPKDYDPDLRVKWFYIKSKFLLFHFSTWLILRWHSSRTGGVPADFKIGVDAVSAFLKKPFRNHDFG